MVHLPDHHLSVVVMINSFDHKCSAAITKGLTAKVLRDLGVIGIIPYFNFVPYGLMMIGAALFLIIIIILHIRKRRRMI